MLQRMDDDEDLLAPAGQVHLDPDTLLLPPASNLKSVSESEGCSQRTNTGDGARQIREKHATNTGQFLEQILVVRELRRAG